MKFLLAIDATVKIPRLKRLLVCLNTNISKNG